MPRFIWRSHVAVEAATREGALEIVETAFPTEDWYPSLHDHVMVWLPIGEPDDVVADDPEPDDGEEDDAPEPACTCPPGLVERGGFRSDCPAHGVTAEHSA